MSKTKSITLTGAFTALLLCAQLALSSVKGVEIVTPLFLTFSYRFGAKRGMIAGTAFSLLRCFLFGFFPSVIILYLIYYNAFAFVVGLYGKKHRPLTLKRFFLLVFFAVAFTALFTLLDDAITPLFYGFTVNAARAYFYASLPVLLTQTVSAFFTSSVLIFPLCRLFSAVFPEEERTEPKPEGN